MSSKKSNIYNTSFNSYNEAINKVLENRGLTQSWLVGNIIDNGQNEGSLTSQVNRWLTGGQNVSDRYKKKINNALNINVKQESSGNWVVSRTNEVTPNAETGQSGLVNEPGANFTIDQLLKEERSRLGIEDIPDTERGRELQDMLGDAVSLLLKIRRSIEMEKRRSDD